MAEGQELKQFKAGDVVAGRYEITEFLGSGLLGATYLARNQQSNKYLAIKFLRAALVRNPKDRARFERAFESAREVKNDKIIRYGEILDHNGLVCFTQEYFKSQSLRQLIEEYQQQSRSFTLQEACQIVIQVLEAADVLHQLGHIHRNLKPENVLVQSRSTGPGATKVVRTIKITDAGLTDILNPTIFAESYVRRDEARYLAPELSGFEHGGSAPSDIYSVGVMLYELLVGQTPRGTYLSPTQLREDLPDHINDIVEIALDANAEGRYPTARDMINDIQRSFSGEVQDEVGPSSLRRTLAAIGAVTVLIVGVGIALSINNQDPLEEARRKDTVLKAQVQQELRLPTEAEMKIVNGQHPEMLYVPDGPFIMGRFNAEDVGTTASQSEPLTKVVKVPGFFIDRYEFPNATKDRNNAPVKPVARVTWEEASSTCQKAGKRLCTEEEWEKACKGPNNTIYAYGDAFDKTKCGEGMDEPYTLGDHADCISGYGVVDMSGGLREWTNTVAGTKGTRRVVKGGLRANDERVTRCAFAVDESVNFSDGTLSFRCCLDVETTAAPAGAAPANGG